MNTFKHPLTVALLSVLLASCGGASQDQGSVSVTSRQVKGVAVDGYLAGATVFADYNNNGKHDSFEPSAITDADGYFSYNPLTTKDYCAADATVLEQASCLKISSGYSSVIIRSVGGYDKSTGEKSTASLAVKTAVSSSGGAVSAVISPLTSVVANAASDAEKTQLLAALDIKEDDLKVDFLSDKGVQSTDTADKNKAAALLQKAVKIQKAVEVLGSTLQNTYTQVGKDDKLSQDAGNHIYSALTSTLLTTTKTADNNGTIADKVLSDTNEVKTILSSAETKLRTAYTDNNITKPTAIGSGSGATTAATQVTQVASVVDTVFTDVKAIVNDPARTTTAVFNSVSSGLRAVEIVASKAKNQDTSLSTAVTVLTTDTNTRTSLLSALESSKFDLSALVSDDFTHTNTLATTAVLPDTAVGFTPSMDSSDAASVLDGKSLRVNSPDNAVPSKQKYSRIELYFGTTTGATKSGPLKACIQYLDGDAAASPNASSDTDLTNSTTRGTYATGTWKLLGDGGYNLLVELKVTDSGNAYQSRVISLGGAAGHKQFRFDFSGSGSKRSDVTWVSKDGITDAPSTVPTTNTLCKARFSDTAADDASLNGG